MAAPPAKLALRKEDFPTSGISDQDSLDKLLKALNLQSDSLVSCLTQGLTFKENVNAEVKDVTVTVPANSSGAFPSGLPYAYYKTTTAQSLTNAAVTFPINYDTKDTDTDNAVTTGAAWKFTVPTGKAGLYQISAGASVALSGALGEYMATLIKNGSEVMRGVRFPSTANSATVNPSVSAVLNLAAGDTIQIGVYQNSGGARALEAVATSNWVTIAALSLSQPPALSVFPLKVATKVKQPVGVVPLYLYDTATAPLVPTLGGLSWKPLGNGQVQLDNLPGLQLGRTYTLRLLILGG